MCQFHGSHPMFLPLVCNKLVKSPTPFFPFLSIARSPKLWELFRFPTNVIYSLRDRRYIFETIQLSKWSLLMCSFRFSLSVKLLTQNGQLSIFLLDLTLGGDGSFGCSSFFPTLSKTPSSAIMVWLRSSAAAAGPISIFLHVANHTTCCDSFKSSEYGSLLKINTEAAEQTNSVLRRITTSTTYMSPMLYLRSLKLFFADFNHASNKTWY